VTKRNDNRLGKKSVGQDYLYDLPLRMGLCCDCFCATGRHLGSNDPAYQEKGPLGSSQRDAEKAAMTEKLASVKLRTHPRTLSSKSTILLIRMKNPFG
jgi:hypothetical protein